MNFTKKLDDLTKEIRAMQSEMGRQICIVQRLTKTVEKAEVATANFLSKCQEHGLECVAIGMRTRRIPVSISYPFSPDGVAFGEGVSRKPDEDGRLSRDPAIWHAAYDAGVASGCGNNGSQQVIDDLLIDGVYELRGGVWKKVE